MNVYLGSVLSALSTGLGAIPVLFLYRHVTHRSRDILLAFAAGVMMAASMMGLIPEALKIGSVFSVITGVILGVIVLTLLEKGIPHVDLEHTVFQSNYSEKAMLILSALTIHNIPEGLSVGISYANHESDSGSIIALAIGLQNAPEGLLVALYLVNQNVNRFKAFLLATATGCIEIITSMLGFFFTSYLTGLTPYGLAFAAGAMFFIIYKELIPESHGHGYETSATYSFVIGLLFMVVIMQI